MLATQTQTAPPDSSRDVARLAAALASPLTGIVKRFVLLPEEGGQMEGFHVMAACANYDALPAGGRIAQPGGSGDRLEGAFAKTVFEAVERYCAAFVDYGNLVLARPEGSTFLTGCDLPLYAPEQYAAPDWPFEPLRSESLIHWVEGESLLSGRRRFYPAALTYIPYEPKSRDECLGPSTSTGMAADWSWVAACTTGLLEVCERDAFTIMWMNRLSMPRLDPSTGARLGPLVERLRRDGGDVTFVDISNDLEVPTAIAVLERELLGRPLVTVGASAKLDVEEACIKALSEAVSEYERLRVRLLDPTLPEWKPAPGFANVTDFEWHGLLYTDPELQRELRFMTGSEELHSIAARPRLEERGSRALTRLLRRVRACFGEVVAVDLTTREIGELGVRVVKVIAPDAVPLNPDHRFPWLGHRRLYDVPVRLGLRRSAAAPDELNPYPHPFS